MDDLIKVIRISASGMRAQGTRLRTISENIANADSLAQTPNDEPYRRKLVTFKNELDKKSGLDLVGIDRIKDDRSDYGKRYDPAHPAADDEGYILTPNVNTLIETLDMRQAQRSYEANLGVIRTSREMLNSVIDILRNN